MGMGFLRPYAGIPEKLRVFSVFLMVIAKHTAPCLGIDVHREQF
jgi:hypothetical protein